MENAFTKNIDNNSPGKMVNILKERIQIQNHCDKQGKILTKSKRKIYTKTISQKEKKKKYKAEIIGYAET